MSPFTPKGESPMWRLVYDHAVNLEPGDIIGYDRLAVLLGYDPSQPGASRTPIHTAARRLLRDHSKTLVAERGKGYRVAQPEEHEGLGRGYQRSARRRMRRGVEVTEYVDRNSLTEKQRAAVDALHHVLTAQAAMLKRHDVRLSTVETATQAQDARLDVLEATLRKHGIDVPKQQTVPGEVTSDPAK